MFHSEEFEAERIIQERTRADSCSGGKQSMDKLGENGGELQGEATEENDWSSSIGEKIVKEGAHTVDGSETERARLWTGTGRGYLGPFIESESYRKMVKGQRGWQDDDGQV